MFSRRAILYAAAVSFVPLLAAAQPAPQKLALYASVGADLVHYDVDVAKATLTQRDSISLPANVQYAWPHASRRYLYVASSDRDKIHHVSALRLDPQTGDMSMLGKPVPLPSRPIHMSTDIPSEYALVAFNLPSDVRVFRINQDFTVGAEVPQPGITDKGFYAHQVRVAPDNRHAIVITRGNASSDPPNPAAMKMFDYNRGVLSNEASIAANGGIGYNPRHLDFHAGKPWIYVSLEAQNKLCMYRLIDGRLESTAAYCKDTLAEPGEAHSDQQAGAVHIHPNGRFVYVANRADGTVDFNGKPVFAGGENSIAVFSIDQTTGEPTLIQNADTRKFHPRTFHLDPSGRLLVAENNAPLHVREGNTVRTVMAGLTVYRIGDDGKLSFQRVYDVDVGGGSMFWMGLVPLKK